jgi:hypothetical protein
MSWPDILSPEAIITKGVPANDANLREEISMPIALSRPLVVSNQIGVNSRDSRDSSFGLLAVFLGLIGNFVVPSAVAADCGEINAPGRGG